MTKLSDGNAKPYESEDADLIYAQSALSDERDADGFPLIWKVLTHGIDPANIQILYGIQ